MIKKPIIYKFFKDFTNNKKKISREVVFSCTPFPNICMVKTVMTNPDLSKASGPDCIPVVILKTCELEFSYILSELFNICLKESCFQIVGRSHRWSLYWDNPGYLRSIWWPHDNGRMILIPL